jgi:hypothetical protein
MTPELVALLLAAVAGVALALLLDRRAAGTLLAGEALLLGIGACALLLLVLAVMGVAWSRTSFGVAFGVVAAIAWYRCLTGVSPSGRPSARSTYAGWLLAAFTIVLLIGYTLFATVAPLWEFDFIADWGLKARVFFMSRTVDWPFLEHAYHRNIHPDYPPLLPLSFDLLAIVRGAWNDQALGLISVAFAAGLLLAVHGLSRDETESPTAAAFITLAMVPFACSPWIGLADGPLVAYATAGLLLIRRGSVLPGAVMLGLGAMTKNEGLSFIVAAAVALLLDKRARDLPRLWPAVAIPLPWLVLRRLHGLSTDITEGNVFARIVEHLRDPGPLIDAFAQYSAGKPLFWIALMAGVVVALRRLVPRERFVLVAVTVQFLFYIAAYLATPHDVDWHVRWSWERLVSHLSPAVTWVVLVSLVGKHTVAPEVK